MGGYGHIVGILPLWKGGWVFKIFPKKGWGLEFSYEKGRVPKK